MNGFVKRALDVRKASFAPMDEAVAASGMALQRDHTGGSAATTGRCGWTAPIADCPWICTGAGVRRAKLFMPGADLLRLPTAMRMDGTANPVPRSRLRIESADDLPTPP